MPSISKFFGISIWMYTEKGGKHHTPHIHASYQDDDAEIGFDGQILAGHIPTKQLRLVQAWMIIHQSELEKNWALVSSGEPAEKIDPIH